MKKSLNLILLSSFFIAFSSGCDRSYSVAADNRNAIAAQPTANVAVVVNTIAETSLDEDKIKSCSPEKIYRGETLTVTFNQPHGGYAAIRRMNDNRWFFLNDIEKSEPVWTVEQLKSLPQIKIQTTAINATNSTENAIAEKIFAKSGRYRIMIGDEDFGQDDPPWTGMCEVEYVDGKRPLR
jgi:hypothetical protein